MFLAVALLVIAAAGGFAVAAGLIDGYRNRAVRPLGRDDYATAGVLLAVAAVCGIAAVELWP